MPVLKILLCILVVIAAKVNARRVIRATPELNKTGCYIVQLKDETSHDKFEELTGVIKEESMDHHIYEKVEGKVSKIITAKLSEDALHRIKLLDNVEFLEQETYATAAQGSIPWHLDRIDQRSSVNNNGKGIDIYILDTGIRYDHSEFEGRALYPGYDPVDYYTGSKQQGADCNGHGTHVASLAAGKTYGAAKNARVYSVRVLGCTSSAPWSYIIDGINYAAEQASQSGRPSIISMSLGGGYTESMNRAVRNVVNNFGIPVVVAAGNDNVDACNTSPASTAEAITVGGTAYGDNMYFYSNGGSCVDIFAPGENILAASYSCSTCTATFSGTSMAAPIVSGAIATLLEAKPTLTPAEIQQHLIATSTKDAINFNRLDKAIKEVTPNRLLYIADCKGDSTETVTQTDRIFVTQTDTVTETNIQRVTLTSTTTATQFETIVSTEVTTAIVRTTVQLTPTPTPEGVCCQTLENFNVLERNLLDGMSAIMDNGIKYIADLIDSDNSNFNLTPTIVSSRSSSCVPTVTGLPRLTQNCGQDRDTPAESCAHILVHCPDSQSGDYYIANGNADSALMYCELHKEIKGRRGLMRIADVNMTDTSQQCPENLSLLDIPKRTCQRGMESIGCSKAVFSTNNITYTTVCGRIHAYQYGTPNAFYWFNNRLPTLLGLADLYVDGVILTNTKSDTTLQHIWTFAGAIDAVDRENPFACPCTNKNLTYHIAIPDFVGEDYFCETGTEERYTFNEFYTDDPLWDGAGCGKDDVCCDRGEYFCKVLPEPATSDIELRLCGNEVRSNEDTPIELIELYVQ